MFFFCLTNRAPWSTKVNQGFPGLSGFSILKRSSGTWGCVTFPWLVWRRGGGEQGGLIYIATHLSVPLGAHKTVSNSVVTEALVLTEGFSPTSQLLGSKQRICFLKSSNKTPSYSHFLSPPGVATKAFRLFLLLGMHSPCIQRCPLLLRLLHSIRVLSSVCLWDFLLDTPNPLTLL